MKSQTFSAPPIAVSVYGKVVTVAGYGALFRFEIKMRYMAIEEIEVFAGLMKSAVQLRRTDKSATVQLRLTRRLTGRISDVYTIDDISRQTDSK